jgi:DNA-directed RNA polymerase sigma subunit (sigma70/sigma32)
MGDSGNETRGDFLADEEMLPEQWVIYRESVGGIRARLEGCLSGVADPERLLEILWLRSLDYTYGEIGMKLGISKQRVRQLMEEAKGLVRKNWGELD